MRAVNKLTCLRLVRKSVSNLGVIDTRRDPLVGSNEWSWTNHPDSAGTTNVALHFARHLTCKTDAHTTLAENIRSDQPSRNVANIIRQATVSPLCPCNQDEPVAILL